MSKIGLYFGSYNPIHSGHVAIANFMLEQTDMEEVWFMVSPQNPLKKEEGLLDEDIRLQMVEIVTKQNPGLKASNFEFDLPKPSYTRTTLDKLKQTYPEYDFQMILGEDNIRYFHLWKDYESILDEYAIWVYPRAGVRSDELNEELLTHHNVHYQINAPLFNLSSTQIRRAIQKGDNVENLIPTEVFTFITENQLYR